MSGQTSVLCLCAPAAADQGRAPEPVSFHSRGFGYVAEIFPLRSRQNSKPYFDSYIRNGVTYRFNLPVVAELVEESLPITKGSLSETYYPLGVRDGRYLIALMAPSREPQPQPAVPPHEPAGPQTQPSQPRGPNEPTLVPAKTVLVVRLRGKVMVRKLMKGRPKYDLGYGKCAGLASSC